MNKSTRIMTTALLMCALVSAQAQEPSDHAAHHPTDSNASAAKPSSSPQNTPMMGKMQENMRAMRDLMQRIRSTSDLAERQKLLSQHRELMQSQMQLMKSAGPSGDMCRGMMEGGADHRPMMEQMMEQMMQHEDANQPGPKKPVK
jgi:TolA-binding protein